MKTLIKKLPHNEIALFAIFFFMMGLLYSRAFMSIGMMLLVGNAVINVAVKENIKYYLQNKYLLLFTSVFLLFAISGLWSSDWNHYYDRVRVKLPYMVLPFAFVVLRSWKKIFFEYVFYFFIIIVMLGISYSLYHYFTNIETISASYSFSKVMPTPFKNDHIRFSIAVVISFVFSIYFLYQKHKAKYLFLVLALIQFVYLHVLAVKTGLLSLYLVCLLLLFHIIIVSKKYVLGSILVLFIAVSPYLMLKGVPTLKAKYDYTYHTFQRIFRNDIDNNYSDAGRVTSYKMAKNIITKNILLGVGAGDVQSAMQTQYVENNIRAREVLIPHNQWLMVWAATGIIGFVLFSFFVFYPLFSKYRKNIFFMCIWIIMLIPLMVEPMLETQYGVAIHIFFLLLLLQFADLQLAKTND